MSRREKRKTRRIFVCRVCEEYLGYEDVPGNDDFVDVEIEFANCSAHNDPQAFGYYTKRPSWYTQPQIVEGRRYYVRIVFSSEKIPEEKV